MSFNKPSFAYAVKEMNYWKNRVQNSSHGEPDPWADRSYRSPSFDSGMDDSRRWQNERMDMGSRNGPPSLFSGRPTHLSSSNQINSNLFDNFSSRSGINRSSDSYRSGNYFRPQGGRITRNSLLDYTRAKRILQKRALNAVGRDFSAASAAIKRKRPFRARKPQTDDKKDVKKESAENDTTTEDKNKTKTDKVPSELRLAIVWDNDAKANISGEQGSLLTKKLEQLLDEVTVAEDGHIPRFYASGLSVGIFRVVCADEKSADWLRGAVENLTDLWEGSKFAIVQQSDINALSHITLTVANNDDEIIVLLKRIEKQNPGVKIEKWRLHREIFEERRRTIVFLVDDESLDYLKKNEWKLFLGLKRLKFTQGVGTPKIMIK